jgi:hypothetical protein
MEDYVPAVRLKDLKSHAVLHKAKSLKDLFDVPLEEVFPSRTVVTVKDTDTLDVAFKASASLLFCREAKGEVFSPSDVAPAVERSLTLQHTRRSSTARCCRFLCLARARNVSPG